MNKSLTILGIETSCDETGVAIYNTQKGMLSNALFSQIELHKEYGGVIPELASRTQLEKIDLIFKTALQQADMQLDGIDAIAVTHTPGLPGSLLVGLCFAKAVAWAAGKKLIGVNHLEGHIFSALIEHTVPFPYLCITASGGHTSLYIVYNYGQYELIGQTKDDAAGEAFDKIAKLMHLGYPGGPIIEKLAQAGDFIDYFNYPRATPGTLDFSFSGLKTAVLYDMVKRGAYDLAQKAFLKADDLVFKQQVASSLLVCIADIFVQKVALAWQRYKHIKAVTFVGGCACNNYLRTRLSAYATQQNLSFFFPSARYCTDNAAMIAFVGAYKAESDTYSDLTLDIY